MESLYSIHAPSPISTGPTRNNEAPNEPTNTSHDTSTCPNVLPSGSGAVMAF